MPTYAFACPTCGARAEVFRSMAEHADNPRPFVCCSVPMERFFSVAPSRAVDHPLSGDRAYAGLRTLEGVDVSTRSKHRAYMKERGLTTADDFTEQWKRQAQQRARELAGEDPTRREDLARAIHQLNNR